MNKESNETWMSEVQSMTRRSQQWNSRVPPHPGHAPGHQQAASSVLYTTSCKHSLVRLLLVRMGEIIARNMLSWLESLINSYCRIQLVHFILLTVPIFSKPTNAQQLCMKTCYTKFYQYRAIHAESKDSNSLKLLTKIYFALRRFSRSVGYKR